jgi:hypothetical protein
LWIRKKKFSDPQHCKADNFILKLKTLIINLKAKRKNVATHLKVERIRRGECAETEAQLGPALSVAALDNVGQVEGKDEHGGGGELGLEYAQL